MAYAKKSYRRTYRRRSTYRRKVAVKPPPAKKTTRMYVRKNAFAVNRLMADVRYLKRAQYGDVQKGLHILDRPLLPTATQPCLCIVNDLQANNPVSGAAGSQWFQLDPTGTNYSVVSTFGNNDATYFAKQNQDIIDTGKAYIGAVSLTFRIFCDPDNGQQISNKRVRIDLFKQKSTALVTPTAVSQLQQLPAISAQLRLRNMATPTLNRWSNEYFHHIGTKWVFLNPSKVNPTDKGTGAALRYCHMSIPRKYLGKITQQVTDPVTSLETTPGEGFTFSNLPTSQRIWCMVSSDDPNTFPGTDPEIQVTCQRYCSYRDHIGSAML